MGYENLKIEFKGLKPNQSFETFIRGVAEKIHWQSPSDAYLQLVCEQTKQAIKTSCRIASLAGVFVAEAVSDCPEKSIKKLEQKIQQQLDNWKRSRFSDFFNSSIQSAS